MRALYPYPVAYHTGLIPVAIGPNVPPPRFVYALPHELGMIRPWLSERQYRVVELEADCKAVWRWPEPDSHLFRAPEKKVPVRLLERIDSGAATGTQGS